MKFDVISHGGAGGLTGERFRPEFVKKLIASRMIENGIFHGIDTDDHRKTGANTGLLPFISSRVGRTGVTK